MKKTPCFHAGGINLGEKGVTGLQIGLLNMVRGRSDISSLFFHLGGWMSLCARRVCRCLGQVDRLGRESELNAFLVKSA